MIFPLTSVEIIRNNRRIIFVDYNIKEGASTIVKSRFGSCAKSVNIESVGITAIRFIFHSVLPKSFDIIDEFALLVSFFIMRVSIRLLVPCLDELLEKSLPDSVEREIEGIVLSFDGVSEPHHLRTRRIGNNYAIEIHIRMDGNISLHKAHETATGIEHRLKEKFGEDTHVGIHVEPVK